MGIFLQNLAAVRKMAAKKGAQIQFQVDITTEEEWSKLMERQGLVGKNFNSKSR